MHIANLLPSDPRPTRVGTSSCRLTGNDAISLKDKLVNALRDTMEKNKTMKSNRGVAATDGVNA